MLILLLIINLTNFYNDDWTGKYYFEEEPVEANAGYYMTMIWELEIYKSGTELAGILEIAGQQTYYKFKVDAINESGKLKILFNENLGSSIYLKKGDLLFVLEKAGTKLITDWENMSPLLVDDFDDRLIQFEKVEE